MFSVINARFRKFKYLWAYKFFLKFYYGQRLRDFPLPVAAKMILSRVAFLSLIPFFLPDRHFLMKYYGAKMYIDLFEAPIAFDRAFGVYEYWTTRLFRNIVKEGMTIVDIGAHQGTYSVLFASLMNDKGRVFAFEPDLENRYQRGLFFADEAHLDPRRTHVHRYRCHRLASADFQSAGIGGGHFGVGGRHLPGVLPQD